MSEPFHQPDEQHPSGWSYVKHRESTRRSKQRARGTRTGRCAHCQGVYALGRATNALFRHYVAPGVPCPGSGRLP